jgi:predicted DsbA family dithiol-disulfide isomerase
MFEQAGLPHAEPLEKVPNSQLALRLGEFARDNGVFDSLHPRLFSAYWARGLDLGDRRVLVEEGAGAGLEESEILDALGDERYGQRVDQQTQTALELGVTGVPAWVIDQRVLVPGAQPHEVFERVLERLGYAPPEGSS